MCNINIVTNINGSRDERVVNLMNVISYLSYDENDDGEGFLKIARGETEIGRKLEKFIFTGKASTLVTHQRFMTSGVRSEDYVHPFETADLIVFHNGVLDCASQGHSDTYVFAQLLQEKYEDYKGDIKKAIEEAHKEVSGFFSIVLYLKRTKQLLYYKNSSASFYYARFNNYFVGSTKKENVDYACKFLKYSKKLIYTPANHTLYDVLDNFSKVCELHIETKTYPVMSYGGGSIYDYDYLDDDDRPAGMKEYKVSDDTFSFWDKTTQRWIDRRTADFLDDEYWKQAELDAEKKKKEQLNHEALDKLFNYPQ